MTNVNPGNRDPRNGRFGGIRKLFGRDKSEDLLQDREDLADDLERDDLAQDDLVEDNRVKRSPAQDHAADRYETAGDGSFDEALDEYYDARDQYDPREERAAREAAEHKTVERETVAREPVARGKHHRREEVDSDSYGYTHGHKEAAGSTAATMGAEIGDYVDGDNNYGYTSKEAVYDDRADYDNYDDELADSVEADRAGRADRADRDDRDDRTVAAPVTRTATAGTGSSTAAAAGGVPKRGLAMILIAVGLLLALWAVYALTKGGADHQAANDPAGQSVQNQNDPNVQGQNGAGQNPNDPNAQGQNAQGQNGAGQNPNDPNAQNRQPGQGGTQGNGAAPVGANNPMTAENETVNIYNNSAMQDFANRVAAQANEKGMKVGEVGNIPGESAIFEQNTVLYDPATPGAEDRARELADKVGGIALANDDRIPAEAKKPGSLTLVLAENREVAL
ncbi:MULTISPECIES: LytR C-terminal domain-containing protein [unclassified Corynebacterium]|uniref:LytR C-terminal domain-containing protein n=1 Tax=unclassified Corynebacterium TaxID=2624378 RepID=UPI0021AA0CA7|nr:MULTISPECIES: LytR C-terminal domain-containing protein [unclassified Corynebacterium]MCT1452147.1 LytR C-terminal domain-containing protein [Corynebacterium sp. p3-SID1145]MCT1461849.1 LytR C-terminal domain-containing protein [Corynebacterium sp. p3-SID1140]MDN8595522.1 LytR C-terminal domain-containing protein [Corynebacterium sp. P4_F2]WKK55382.1 LytR C-terminal domain-containing protein [Corynebacterium sp. P4-C1]WKK62791.1 LytR C-terminal domain-containing protein [Corynebacterium sp.